MRILVLSQWYVPEPDIKIHLLGKSLAARGHQVTALTAFPNYPSGKVYPGYRIRWRQWEYLDGVRILRLPLYPDHSRSSIKRTLNYLSFSTSASILGPSLCGPADVIWAYHPPLTAGIPAWWIGLLRRVPFVYEIQDMWPETLAATEMIGNRTAHWGLGRLAKFVYKRAAAIIVISPGFKRNLITKGVPAEKIHIFRNWADEEIFRPLPPDSKLAEEHGLGGRFNIIYAGNLGIVQGLHNVLEAAVILRDLAAIQFVFIGDGVEEAALRKQAADRELKNVRFIGRQPMERMAHFYALGDALLVHLKKDALFEITIPGKVTAYMACGRPIICAVLGDAAQVVREAGAGVTCSPEKPETLADTVRKLYEMSPEQRQAMGESGRRTYLAELTRGKLVERYEHLFQDISLRYKGSRNKK